MEQLSSHIERLNASCVQLFVCCDLKFYIKCFDLNYHVFFIVYSSHSYIPSSYLFLLLHQTVIPSSCCLTLLVAIVKSEEVPLVEAGVQPSPGGWKTLR